MRYSAYGHTDLCENITSLAEVMTEWHGVATTVKTLNVVLFGVVELQASYYSYALKSLITISTIILLCLITAYHSIQAQVRTSVYYFVLWFFYVCIF